MTPPVLPSVDPEWRAALGRLHRHALQTDEVVLGGLPGTGGHELLDRFQEQVLAAGSRVVRANRSHLEIRTASRVVHIRQRPGLVHEDGCDLHPFSIRDAARALRRELPDRLTYPEALDLAVAAGGLPDVLDAFVALERAGGRLDPWLPLAPQVEHTVPYQRFLAQVRAEWACLPPATRQARVDWLAGRQASSATGWPHPPPQPLANTTPLPADLRSQATDATALLATVAQPLMPIVERVRNATFALMNQSRPQQASRLVAAFHGHAVATDRVELLLLWSQCLRMGDHPTRGLAVLTGIETRDLELDTRVAMARSSLLGRLGRREEALTIVVDIESRRLAAGSPTTYQLDYVILAALEHGRGLDEVRTRVARVCAGPSADHRAAAWLVLAQHEGHETEGARVDEAYAGARAEAQEAGVDRLLPMIDYHQGLHALNHHQPAQARRLLRRAKKAFLQQGLTLLTTDTKLWLALLDAEAGSIEEASIAIRSLARVMKKCEHPARLAALAVTSQRRHRVPALTISPWNRWWERICRAYREFPQ